MSNLPFIAGLAWMSAETSALKLSGFTFPIGDFYLDEPEFFFREVEAFLQEAEKIQAR